MYLLKWQLIIKRREFFPGDMIAGSMPILIISETFMVPGCKKCQLMPDLPVPTGMAQKAQEVVPIAIMTHSIHLTAYQGNQLHGRLRKG